MVVITFLFPIRYANKGGEDDIGPGWVRPVRWAGAEGGREGGKEGGREGRSSTAASIKSEESSIITILLPFPLLQPIIILHVL